MAIFHTFAAEALRGRICSKFDKGVVVAELRQIFDDRLRGGNWVVGEGRKSHFSLTKPMAVNTVLPLPRSKWTHLISSHLTISRDLILSELGLVRCDWLPPVFEKTCAAQKNVKSCFLDFEKK